MERSQEMEIVTDCPSRLRTSIVFSIPRRFKLAHSSGSGPVRNFPASREGNPRGNLAGRTGALTNAGRCENLLIWMFEIFKGV